MEPARYTLSLAQNLGEKAFGAVLGGLLVGLIAHYFMYLDLPLQILLSVVFGAATFGLYSWRFIALAPKSVEFSDHGLTLEFGDGRTDQVAWAEITRASFASIFGLRWKFWLANSTLILRADGFTGWFRISRLILETLAARGIEVSTDIDGGNFLFEIGGDDYSP